MIDHCPVCGGRDIRFRKILWDDLIAQWRLAPHEAEYVARQQGAHCASCGCNLRSMALAVAIMRCYAYAGTFTSFIEFPDVRGLKVLELNEAGELTRLLARLPNRTLARYPEIDMTRLPYEDASWDLVVHSDTLEHVPQPIRGLAECRRVLRSHGFCVFTVPMIVGRLTISRAGMEPSYHGSADALQPDYVVQTEYGADAWTHVIQAGFSECRIVSLDYPAAQAMVCVV